MICEVGCYEHSCKNIPDWSTQLEIGLAVATLQDMLSDSRYDGDDCRIYTNNMDLVSQFRADKIVCIGKNGKRALLSEHPDWNNGFHGLSTGGFVDVVAYHWPDE